MNKTIFALLAIATYALGGCGSEGQITAQDFSEAGAEPVAQTSQALTGATRYQAYAAGLPPGRSSVVPSPFVDPGHAGSGTVGICAFDQILGGFGGAGDAVWIDVNTTTGLWEVAAAANQYGTSKAPSVEMVCAPLSNFSNLTPLNTSTTYSPLPFQGGVAETGARETAAPDTIHGATALLHSNLNLFAGTGGFIGDDTVFGSANAFAQLKTQSFSSLGGSYNVTDAVHAQNDYQPLNQTAAELAKTDTSAAYIGIYRNSPSAWSYTGASGTYGGTRDILASNRSGATLTSVALTGDATNNFCFITGVGRDFQDANHAAKIVPNGAGYALAVFGTQTEATASCIPYAQQP